MATHPLPKGSCNVPCNVPEPVRAALGRLAFARDESVSAVLRGLIRERLAVAAQAGEISAEVAERALAALSKGGRVAICLMLGLFALGDAIPRGRARTRTGSAVAARVLRVNRKIGEWEAFA